MIKGAAALLALVTLAAPLAAQRYPHANTVMPANYLAAMPPAERVLADFAGPDSVEARARRYAAVSMLQRVLTVLTDDHMFNPGLTPDEDRLRLGYLEQENRLVAMSGMVPGLTAMIDSYCCGERSAGFRRELFDRYFSPDWQAAYLGLERMVEQRENNRRTAMNPAPPPPEPAIPATGWARLWPRGSQAAAVVEFGVVSSRLMARVVSLGLIESTDSGLTWVTSHQLMNDGFGYPLAAIGDDVWATSWGGVVRAGDAAAAGRPASEGGGATMVTALAAVNGKLFAASQRHGLLVSEDRGQSWRQPTMMGDPERGRSVPVISALAASGRTLFVAAVGHGIYRTSDDAASWTAMNAGPPGFNSQVRSITASGNQVYLASQGGVFVATRTGAVWSPFVAANGGLTNETVRRFAIDDAGNVFATAQTGLVFVRGRRGGDWRSASAGLPREGYSMDGFDRPLFVLGPYLYMGNQRGIWRRRVAEMLGGTP